MNADRRKRIEAIIVQLNDIKADIEAIQQEEHDYAENMPENMQGSDRHSKAEEAADSLEEAADNVDEIVSNLESAIS